MVEIKTVPMWEAGLPDYLQAGLDAFEKGRATKSYFI